MRPRCRCTLTPAHSPCSSAFRKKSCIRRHHCIQFKPPWPSLSCLAQVSPSSTSPEVSQSKEDPFAELVDYDDTVVDRLAIKYITDRISDEVGALICLEGKLYRVTASPGAESFALPAKAWHPSLNWRNLDIRAA